MSSRPLSQRFLKKLFPKGNNGNKKRLSLRLFILLYTIIMKTQLRYLLTALFLAIFGVSNASTATWFGYALGCFNGASWEHKYISFNIQNPDAPQVASGTLPEDIWAATYVDGYVWFVTTSGRNLYRAPFDNETQTIGTHELVKPGLDTENRLIVDMSYNPVNQMLYYLCQDSQYNCYLKCFNLNTPAEVTNLGSLGVRMWTLAINSQGQAYGIDYLGDLYQVDLSNAGVSLVGPTGKSAWYTQSMAFDLDTDELYWAQISANTDHGLYQVDPQTAQATSLGEIGGGTQLTGLFMVPSANEPQIISEIYLEGFSVPVWGEHPDYDMEVDPAAPYGLADLAWHYVLGMEDPVVLEEEYFDDEGRAYYLATKFSPREGYVFANDTKVYYNGDSTIFELGTIFGSDYWAFTIDFFVTNPSGVVEQPQNSHAVWPNPTSDMLHLEGMEGETVCVYDVKGNLVLQKPYAKELNVSDLTPGVYTVKVANRWIKFLKE